MPPLCATIGSGTISVRCGHYRITAMEDMSRVLSTDWHGGTITNSTQYMGDATTAVRVNAGPNPPPGQTPPGKADLLLAPRLGGRGRALSPR